MIISPPSSSLFWGEECVILLLKRDDKNKSHKKIDARIPSHDHCYRRISTLVVPASMNTDRARPCRPLFSPFFCPLHLLSIGRPRDRLPALDFDVTIYNVVTSSASRAGGRSDRWDLVQRKRRMEKEEAHKSHNSHKRDCIEVRARARTPSSPSFLRSALPLLFQRPWSGGGGGCLGVGGFA